MRIAILGLIGLMFLTACGTLATFDLAYDAKKKEDKYFEAHYCEHATTTYKLPYVYSGVRADFLYLFGPAYCGWGRSEVSCIGDCCFLGSSPFVLLDLPFSFIVDTLALPRTIYLQMKNGNLIDPPYFEIARRRRSREKNYEPYEDYERALAVLEKNYATTNKRDHHLSKYDNEIHELAKYYVRKERYIDALNTYELLLALGHRQSDKVLRSHAIDQYYQEMGGLCARMKDGAGELCRSKIKKYWPDAPGR